MKIILSIALLIGVGLAGTWSYREYGSEPVYEYELAEVEFGALRNTINATGTLHTTLNVDVGSQVSGKITEVYVDFNDPVRRDQPLARIDQHSFQATLDGAKAALAVAKARVKINESGVDAAHGALLSSNEKLKVFEARAARASASLNEAQLTLHRNNNLSRSGALSTGDLDEIKAELAKRTADLNAATGEAKVQEQQIIIAKANLAKAQGELLASQSLIPQHEASLALAEIELGRTIIRSPIDGIVINRAIEPGQTVAASLSAPNLFNIAQSLQTMVVHTMVDEADIGQIQINQKAIFNVDAYPDRNFSGKVIQIRKSPVTNRSVVSYAILISTENPELLLLPGMTALVRITVFESKDVLKIPSKALHFRPASEANHTDNHTEAAQAPIVWVLRQGKPAPITVKTGIRDDRYTELLNGSLDPGAPIIVGQRRLKR